jgi:hypothetical protein
LGRSHQLCKLHSKSHSTKALKNITPEEAWTKIKPDVSHFHVFGSIAWAHIPDEKRKALQPPKSEKCIFVGYSKDVKGYRLLQSHCNEIIIRRDVKFDENILAYEPNSTVVSSSACEPSSAFVPYFDLVSSSNDDSEDENPPPPAHPPPDKSFEHEPALAPLLPRWVCST